MLPAESMLLALQLDGDLRQVHFSESQEVLKLPKPPSQDHTGQTRGQQITQADGLGTRRNLLVGF